MGTSKEKKNRISFPHPFYLSHTPTVQRYLFLLSLHYLLTFGNVPSCLLFPPWYTSCMVHQITHSFNIYIISCCSLKYFVTKEQGFMTTYISYLRLTLFSYKLLFNIYIKEQEWRTVRKWGINGKPCTCLWAI